MKDSAPTPDQPVWFLEQISPPHAWLTDGKGDSWWTHDPHKARIWKTKEEALTHANKLPKESERCYPTEHIFMSTPGQPKQAAAITKQEQEDKREEKRLIEMLSSSDGAEGKQPAVRTIIVSEQSPWIELNHIRHDLYESIPKGQIGAFELTTCIANHLKKLDRFIDNNAGLKSQSSTVAEEKKSNACEKCWGDAYVRMISDPSKSQAEHYRDLLFERKDNPCKSVPPADEQEQLWSQVCRNENTTIGSKSRREFTIYRKGSDPMGQCSRRD